jgi:DNA-binding Xre family transcriptional regulator
MAKVGFTQGALAERIGMSENTLSSRMVGASSFNIDEIDKICEVLNIQSNDEKAAIFLASSSQNRDGTPA